MNQRHLQEDEAGAALDWAGLGGPWFPLTLVGIEAMVETLSGTNCRDDQRDVYTMMVMMMMRWCFDKDLIQKEHLDVGNYLLTGHSHSSKTWMLHSVNQMRDQCEAQA